MDDQLEWKEAKGGQNFSDTESEEYDAQVEELDDQNDWEEDKVEEDELDEENFCSVSDKVEQTSIVTRGFSHKQLNLSLNRNITSLADSTQHASRPNYLSESQTQPFDKWLENAIVAISPSADIILFSSHIPERVTFFAKLRKEPISHYTTKSLELPLDYDEQVTSLLCLPIMSTQKTALGLVDWTALVVGLSSGYIKFYTDQSVCLLSLKFQDEPVISIKCQTLKNNTHGKAETHFAHLVDTLLIVYKSTGVLIDGLTLYENLRLSKAEVIRNGSNYEPAYTLLNLPTILNCQKWKLDNFRGSTMNDGDILGIRRTTLFDSMKSDSINFECVPAKSSAQTLAFIGRDPFLTCYRESKETNSPSYTEMIGSLFSLWNKKPPPQKVQINEVSESNSLSFFDKDRHATSIISSPDKRLLAVTDEFGRVLLIDSTNWLIVRMWKGYRNAQCGWVEAKKNSEQRSCPRAFFLVIYAPRRGLVEVWSAQRGPRVAAYNVGKSCRLLYSNFKMLNIRADKNSTLNPIAEQSYSSNCYLLNPKSETVFSVEVPYTFSLYKYGDLKSRDHLLINDLMNAIQQDAEVTFILELLHRIVLTESLEKCIQKIAYNLPPCKILVLMENLIIRIMKNYDNLSGQSMTSDDVSSIELCRRVIKLCEMFQQLSQQPPQELSLPDVNQRLIDQYEEHPQEVDEFSEKLGWSTFEVLRYISLLALERSYRESYISNPWPCLGEPLAWNEFITCFDLNRIDTSQSVKEKDNDDSRKQIILLESSTIRLISFDSEFLNKDKVKKTAVFLYNRFSEVYAKFDSTSLEQKSISLNNCSRALEPSSRLVLLMQFWLSSRLSYHWKMWSFLQAELGQISDELKVIAMSQNDDKILVETWKKIYELILESDNLFAAIIATAAIKSDTLRMIQDNEKRDRVEKEDNLETSDTNRMKDWECLCIDAERMSLLSQQLDDVFLLSLLLKYSPTKGYLIDSYIYRIPRISVANIHNNGPTIVSELVAQWTAQSGINLNIFKKELGSENDEMIICKSDKNQEKVNLQLFKNRLTTNRNHEEHAKELLNYIKASFPCSLDADVILLHCFWEFCRKWTSNRVTLEKMHLLKRAYTCLTLLKSLELRHKLACVAYKTFFQRTFDRLVFLVETNSTILNVKSSRIRDTFTRKELNMGEECLEDFVQFCCNLSQFMLETLNEASNNSDSKLEKDLKDRLLNQDSWWNTSTHIAKAIDVTENTELHHEQDFSSKHHVTSSTTLNQCSTNTLVSTTLSLSKLFDVDFLIELNSLANLMNLIFKLRIVKAYPLQLIGESSRQILQLSIHQLPVGGASGSQTSGSMKNMACSLYEMRHKFARKCILNLVSRMTEESSEFSGEDEYDEDIDTALAPSSSLVFTCGLKRSAVREQKEGATTEMSGGSSAKSKRGQCQKWVGKTENNRYYNNMDSSNKTSTSDSSLQVSTVPTPDSGEGEVDDVDGLFGANENNESMLLFTNLLSLATEWELNRNELYLELVFELYRCNLDKIASQISNRVQDQQTLANGLLKISSQRVLVLFGLSPQISGSEWRRRSDKWSVFQPNVASWLKSIQQEEMRREIACLNFSESLKLSQSDKKSSFGLQTYVLHALRKRTILVFESITNHLDGQASRLAYDLLQLLESQLLDKMLSVESELSPED